MRLDHDTMMGLIRQHFGKDLQKAVTFERWKDGIEIDYPIAAIELFAEAVWKLATTQKCDAAKAAIEQINKATVTVFDDDLQRYVEVAMDMDEAQAITRRALLVF